MFWNECGAGATALPRADFFRAYVCDKPEYSAEKGVPDGMPERKQVGFLKWLPHWFTRVARQIDFVLVPGPSERQEEANTGDSQSTRPLPLRASDRRFAASVNGAWL